MASRVLPVLLIAALTYQQSFSFIPSSLTQSILHKPSSSSSSSTSQWVASSFPIHCGRRLQCPTVVSATLISSGRGKPNKGRREDGSDISIFTGEDRTSAEEPESEGEEDFFKAHGRHICLDYTGFCVDAKAGAELTLHLIRDAVRESGVREVHSKVVVLGEDGLSPPGFTGVCLIDESHVTSHCYSDRGWLAIDVFTCGSHPPEAIATNLHHKLLANVPGLKMMRGVTLDRFLHQECYKEREEGEGDLKDTMKMGKTASASSEERRVEEEEENDVEGALFLFKGR